MVHAMDASSHPELYSVTELATNLGVTARALRFYEDKGLIEPRRIGNTRVYTHRDRGRLVLILRGKRLGWSLSEIRESFQLYDSSLGEEAQLEAMLGKLESRRETLIAQREDIDSALRDLEQVESNARQALRDIRSGQPRQRRA